MTASSNNHGPAHFDWGVARRAGVIGAFIKATEGTGYVNPFYFGDMVDAVAEGIPTLAYHFARFGNVAAEASAFVAVAGERARVLDSETSTDAGWQNAFLAALNLPANQEMDYGSASTLPRGVRSLLWPASYGRNYGFGDCWQYSSTQYVPGIGNCDVSVWVGPDADFYSLFSIAPPPAPDPTPQEAGMGSNTGIKTITKPGHPLEGTDIVVALVQTTGDVWLKDRQGSKNFTQNGNQIANVKGIPGTLEMELTPDGGQVRILFQTPPTGRVRVMATPGARNADGTLTYGVEDMA